MGFLSSIGGLVGTALGGPVVGALVSGGASLIGGAMANKSSAKSVSDQMNFQQDMSNTSYQRGMADMKAAGLNPMLAYQQGGASVPSGASYQAHDVLTPAVNSAQSAIRLKNDVSAIQAGISKTVADTAVSKSQAVLNSDMSVKTMQDADKSVSERLLNEAMIKTQKTQQDANSAAALKSRADAAATMATLPDKLRIGKYGSSLTSTMGAAVDAVSHIPYTAKQWHGILDSHFNTSDSPTSAKSLGNMPRGILPPPAAKYMK